MSPELEADIDELASALVDAHDLAKRIRDRIRNSHCDDQEVPIADKAETIRSVAQTLRDELLEEAGYASAKAPGSSC